MSEKKKGQSGKQSVETNKKEEPKKVSPKIFEAADQNEQNHLKAKGAKGNNDGQR